MRYARLHSRLLIVAAGLAPALSGCDVTAIGDIGGGRLIEIQITGDSIVQAGDTIRLSATGRVDGLIGLFSYDPLRDARWRADPTGRVSITLPPASPSDTLASLRIITGLHPGTVVIVASARGVAGTRVVRVIPNLAPQHRLAAIRSVHGQR